MARLACKQANRVAFVVQMTPRMNHSVRCQASPDDQQPQGNDVGPPALCGRLLVAEDSSAFRYLLASVPLSRLLLRGLLDLDLLGCGGHWRRFRGLWLRGEVGQIHEHALALPAIPPAARWWQGTGVIAVEGLIACSWGQPNRRGDRRRWSVGFGGIGGTSVRRRAHGRRQGLVSWRRQSEAWWPPNKTKRQASVTLLSQPIESWWFASGLWVASHR